MATTLILLNVQQTLWGVQSTDDTIKFAIPLPQQHSGVKRASGYHAFFRSWVEPTAHGKVNAGYEILVTKYTLQKLTCADVNNTSLQNLHE